MKKLWIAFTLVLLVSFLVLGWVGSRIYQEAPPIPETVVTSDGKPMLTGKDIGDGQNVWQALGGMEVGSVWGHGSYVAPDWTADYLHRECEFMLDKWAYSDFGSQKYADLQPEQKAQLQMRLEQSLRTNTYDPETGTLTVHPLRQQAFEHNLAHYAEVFSEGHERYAIQAGAQSDKEKLRQMTAFFFWTAWASAANRPGAEITYTSNWPHEPLVSNRPSGETIVWTGVSVILLLAGIGALVWWYAGKVAEEEKPDLPKTDPILEWKATPSQQATIKYFWVVTALILVQMLLGVVTAHYGVEGDGFYGFPLSEWLPYSVTRTWHVQMGLFWIATAWLGAGLFICPLVSGSEPKGQSLGVNVLFVALLVVVVGSLAGQWLSIHHYFSASDSFLWGHQGYEYVDLGRIWQLALFAGLLLWLFLMTRGIWPALRKPSEHRSLITLFFISTVAIALFYGAGFFWGQHTHLSIVEYWRWWVVHLWVEGFFEVFATAVIAFFFTRLGLVRPKLAASAALLSATIYLSGGIIGTLHHLYFSGTPTIVLALGSVFSALEVVPLVLVGYAAWEDLRMSRSTPWIQKYKWPIYFFISVAFWNLVGAGLFGFMINPPIALYYMQGLNTTPVHAHAALFGVYGMLGIGLMLVCLRALLPAAPWKEGMLWFSFWSLNIGLFLMVTLSLLPVGLMQTWAAVDTGYWYARSPEFMGTEVMQTLRWLRVPGDTLFFLGAVALAVFIAGLKAGFSWQDAPAAPKPVDKPSDTRKPEEVGVS
jgi:nitric oxide reductase subunit B